MTAARKVLHAFVIFHAAAATFGMAQFLFFPERFLDLVPDDIALTNVRYSLALLAVLPATFLAWDIVLLLGLRAGEKRALLVGVISGTAALMGAVIHAAFQQWSTMAVDGSVGLVFLVLTAWTWKTWTGSDPMEADPRNRHPQS